VNQKARSGLQRNTVSIIGAFSHREVHKLRSCIDFYATVGCHPTRTTDFDKYDEDGPEGYLQALDDLISANLTGRGRVVALGELGLGVCGVDIWLSTQHKLTS